MLGIAAWRLAYMLVYEDGPRDILRWLRRRVGVSDAPMVQVGEPEVRAPVLAEVFSCIWCMTFWTALLMGLVWWIFPAIIVIFAIAGAAIVVHSALMRINSP